ncbi:hypothetical protein, partial [Mycobacterium riyadhense]
MRGDPYSVGCREQCSNGPVRLDAAGRLQRYEEAFADHDAP